MLSGLSALPGLATSNCLGEDWDTAYSYWDAYYRTDSIDSGVSHFNYSGSEHSGDPDLLITDVTSGDSFTGLASGSFSEFESQPSRGLTVQKTVCGYWMDA